MWKVVICVWNRRRSRQLVDMHVGTLLCWGLNANACTPYVLSVAPALLHRAPTRLGCEMLVANSSSLPADRRLPRLLPTPSLLL